MSDNRAQPDPTPRQLNPGQPSLASYALGLLVGCCLCASLIASLI